MNERDYFTLSLDQGMIIRWMTHVPASMLNLALRIDIESELDENLFRQALRVSVERLPYMRCRLHRKDDGTVVQYISEMSEQKFSKCIDGSRWSESKLRRQVSHWARAEFPDEQMDVQLFHVELIKTAGNQHCLFFCGHHVIMDIYAVVFFVKYLDRVYYALSSGTELPPEGGSPKKMALDRNEYRQSSKYQRDCDWFKEQSSHEPMFTSINGLGGHEYIKGQRVGRPLSKLQRFSREKIYPIPDDLGRDILLMSEKMNISPNMFYFFALRNYLAAVCHTDDVTIMTPISYRTTLSNKTGGLTSAFGFNFQSIISRDLGFAEGLKKINLLNYDYLRHAELPVRDQEALIKGPHGTTTDFDYDYYSVAYSYVPFASTENIHLRIKFEKIDPGIAMHPVYLLIMNTEQNEGPKCIYQYAFGAVKSKSIDRCHNFMIRFLELGLKNPNEKIGTLIDQCI